MTERRPGVGTKLYYSIGEVAELTGLPPYTLRSWEKEFPWLRPKRVRGKNRAYRARDIGIILLIKRLLHEERYSTVGARKKLRDEPGLIQEAAEGFAGRGGRPPSSGRSPAAAAGLAASPREASPPGERPGESGPGALLREVVQELRTIAGLLE